LVSGCSGADEDTGPDADCEVCDGIDNDGDGEVDEDYADVDGDGVADCIDEDTELCDGWDNNGNGMIDELFPDTDGDGTADCVDPEQRDGLDNDGDGDTDEGFDDDGDGVADCLQELCNCEDDDGDGEVDEGLDCTYAVTMTASADDRMDVYVDGAAAGSSAGWSSLYNQTFSLPAGTHHIAAYARDQNGQIAGFNAHLEVPGQPTGTYDTGGGAWSVTRTDPTTTYGASWTTGAAATAMQADSAHLASASCNSTWSYSPSGAPWVWADDCSREDLYPKNWYYLELEVCPESDTEACDGEDNDGDGAVDEGYVDSDFDGVADCIEVEDCDGLDNNGDGAVDEGYADTDGDGVADCVDAEECDGLDNNGDGWIDEGFSDIDGDGIADCVDEEECDGLDNNGDGTVDEGYTDTDGDGVADCVDAEICDCSDDDGDGLVDEDLDCTYEVEMLTSADDTFEAWFDGASWGSATGWSIVTTLTTTTTTGPHTIAVHAEDIARAIAGFNARVHVPGAADDAWDTGLGLWLAAYQSPAGYGASSTWTTTPYSVMTADSSWLATASCTGTWGTGATGPSGGDWVWAGGCGSPGTYTDNWFLLEFEVCPEAIVDEDDDGFVASDDCDDGDPAVYPGAPEVCGNGIDDDCDPTTNCDELCIDEYTYPASCGGTPFFSGPAPVLYWDGSGLSGGSLTDSSGNGYDGTPTGTVSAGDGVAGDGIELGTSSGATVSSSKPSAWTVSQWVRPDSFPASDLDFLTSLGNGTTSYTGWAVVLNPSGLPGVYVEGGTSRLEEFVYDSDPVCTGAWTHVVVSWDQTTVRLYINGELVNSSVPGYSSIPYGSLPFVLGFDMNRYGRYLDGALDEVGLWDSALTDDEIAALFTDGACATSSW
jgi:hypothetical protein